MDEIRNFLRSRSVANLTIVIINVAVFLILSCFGDTENADFMAAHVTLLISCRMENIIF